MAAWRKHMSAPSAQQILDIVQVGTSTSWGEFVSGLTAGIGPIANQLVELVDFANPTSVTRASENELVVAVTQNESARENGGELTTTAPQVTFTLSGNLHVDITGLRGHRGSFPDIGGPLEAIDLTDIAGNLIQVTIHVNVIGGTQTFQIDQDGNRVS
jgi:hypothetical protein